MSKRLKDEIVGDLDIVSSDWRRLSQETEEKLRSVNTYYSNVNTTKNDVMRRSKEDSNQINQFVERHNKLAAKAKNAANDLKAQVQSSESKVQKMKKFGLPAAVGFTVLGMVIGLAIGVKYPGLGQPIAIGVGAVIGFVVFGLFAFILYFVMKTRAERRKGMWRYVLNENQGSMGMAQKMEEKRRVIKEIKDNLRDIQEDNYDNAIKAVVNANREYLG